MKSFGTYSDRHELGCLLLCARVVALLRCVLCCARGSTTTYILVHTTAVVLLRYTGTSVPPDTMAHEKAWSGMTDRCCKVDGPTFEATCKCQELHAPRKQKGRRMHVRTYFFWYLLLSARTDFLLCAGGLCCAALCARLNDIYTRTCCSTSTAVLLLCCCLLLLKVLPFYQLPGYSRALPGLLIPFTGTSNISYSPSIWVPGTRVPGYF